MKAEFVRYVLNFKQPSGTSRGILTRKPSYFVRISEAGHWGLGECGLLPGLSVDDVPGYEAVLRQVCQEITAGIDLDWAKLLPYPSIRFGLEMAYRDFYSQRQHILYPSDFTEGNALQDINGLIWMGNLPFMLDQLKARLADGFTCIKMKIGAIDFEAECQLLQKIRNEFSPQEIELRVDANGAFSPDTALEKLKRLADFHIHSIEQPIKPRQYEEMAKICTLSPIPIALDEELIGVHRAEEKLRLLKNLMPQFIILKPSLIGGFQSSTEWIQAAEQVHAGWWVTSALESNVGLNAIAQWTYTLHNPMPQGLGTGSLFTNNFPSPLYIKEGKLGYNPQASWVTHNLGPWLS